MSIIKRTVGDKKKMCFRSYQLISKIIFTNYEIFVKHLEASAQSTTPTVTGAKMSLS